MVYRKYIRARFVHARTYTKTTNIPILQILQKTQKKTQKYTGSKVPDTSQRIQAGIRAVYSASAAHFVAASRGDADMSTTDAVASLAR
jgi:hypothetical protein